MTMALILSAVLLLIGSLSLARQWRNRSDLRRHQSIASDDLRYRKFQIRRRGINSVLLIVLAAMLAGSFLSGMERRADELGEQRRLNAQGEKEPITEDEKALLRVWSCYWISVLLLLFVIITLAIVDFWSTRRYAWNQLRRIQDEQRTLLERDLAVYRQQQLNKRMRPAKDPPG